MIKYIKGGLLQLAVDGEFDAIVHGCNCFNAMGKGIALTIKSRFPAAYAADCKTTKSTSKKPIVLLPKSMKIGAVITTKQINES